MTPLISSWRKRPKYGPINAFTITSQNALSKRNYVSMLFLQQSTRWARNGTMKAPEADVAAAHSKGSNGLFNVDKREQQRSGRRLCVVLTVARCDR